MEAQGSKRKMAKCPTMLEAIKLLNAALIVEADEAACLSAVDKLLLQSC